MWANAQPDGRPAEYRWRPLFNATSAIKAAEQVFVKNCNGKIIRLKFTRNAKSTRMWADAQCDSRPAKYRWRHLFNAAKFG